MEFDYKCDLKCSLLGVQEREGRVGYLTDFFGLGLKEELAKNITLYTPYNNATAPSYAGVKIAENKVGPVIGIIDHLFWGGNIGDPFQMSFWVDSTNKITLHNLKIVSLTTNVFTKIGWWIGNYDKIAKAWYEEHYPKSAETLTGVIKSSEDLSIDTTNPKEVNGHFYFNVSLTLYTAADSFVDFVTATGSGDNTVKHWGIEVGTTAK